MNPGDRILFSALTAHDQVGSLQMEARGTNLKFRKFDPTLYISNAINRTLALICFLAWSGFMWFLAVTVEFHKEGPVIIVLFFLLMGAVSGFLAVLMYGGLVSLVRELKTRSII